MGPTVSALGLRQQKKRTAVIESCMENSSASAAVLHACLGVAFSLLFLLLLASSCLPCGCAQSVDLSSTLVVAN